MRVINGYWVDDNDNKWACNLYTIEQANKLSMTLSSCHNCKNCNSCYNCYSCVGGNSCDNCRFCYYCNSCDSCGYCNNCNCCNCCKYCDSCGYCNGCKYCNNCNGCDNYTSNPQQIVSDKIGGRKAQTTIYYDGITTQVVCGCFRGNIDEFEAKVKETHSDNEQYLGEYLDFIGRCRKFWGIE